MKIELSSQEGYTLVQLHGLLDESCKAAFDQHLHPLIDQGVHRFLVDLSAADRISSAGIGHLVTLVSRANTKGGRVVFVNLSPFVRSIFHATKLTKFLDVDESREAGVQRLLQSEDA